MVCNLKNIPFIRKKRKNVKNKKMLQNYTHNMGKNQNIDNIMGLILLPKNPLFFKNQPFYTKKLCGVSILERNINILIKMEYEIYLFYQIVQLILIMK